VFNVEGTLDLAHAIYLANVRRAFNFMGPACWIPSFWVPALLVTHYIVFVILLRPWKGRWGHLLRRSSLTPGRSHPVQVSVRAGGFQLPRPGARCVDIRVNRRL
jgi:hypothetical protein